MSEENIKLFNETVHTIYNFITEKPLQVLDIFNNFFGENKIDMQGICSEDELREHIKTAPITHFIKDWDILPSSKCIIDLSQDKFEEVLKLLLRRETLYNIMYTLGNNMFILIHFPQVRITNEHDRFVDIRNLWAKVKINYTGTMSGSFELNRSEYPAIHFLDSYMHSHVSRIPRYDFTVFQTPCTGSGPINNTMVSLWMAFDSDLWQLFCLELSKYVTVESISGTPYHYLEKIGTSSRIASTGSFTVCNRVDVTTPADLIKKFVEYFIRRNCLKFNYVNGCYSIGMSYIEYMVLISNEFIKWYNKQFNEKKTTLSLETLLERGVVRRGIISNNHIYYLNPSNTAINLNQYIGEKVCTFKGKEITINITDIDALNTNNESIILNHTDALYILTKILKVLNYRYGRDTARNAEHQASSNVKYL